MPNSSAIKEEALRLAEMGLSIHPLRPRQKIPLFKSWPEKCTTQPEIIEEYFKDYPSANLGIVTGEKSRMFVLDVDGAKGIASLKQLTDKFGQLPQTVEVDTGSGGKHFYFQWPKNNEIRNSASTIAEGLDIRGNGGQVVAPPSIHPNGRLYKWAPTSGKEIFPAPDWLLTLLNNSSKKSLGQRPKKISRSEWRNMTSGVTEGHRNDTLTRLAGKLLGSSIDPFVTMDLLQALNKTSFQPPLEEQEVAGIVESISKNQFLKMERRRGIRKETI